YEEQEAEEAAAKLLEGRFTPEDFLEQMQQIKKMGPISNLMSMLPGVPKEVRDVEIDDRELDRVEAIIRSMTAEEREQPDIIDGSRRARIARGSGRQPQDVQNLLTQFKQMQKMLNNMSGLGTKAVARAQKKRNKKAKKGKGGGRVTPKGGNK